MPVIDDRYITEHGALSPSSTSCGTNAIHLDMCGLARGHVLARTESRIESESQAAT